MEDELKDGPELKDLPDVEVDVEPEPEPAGAELTPTEGAMDIEQLHGMIVELQGLVANMQATLDAQAPIEAAAEVEEEVADEGDLLEEGQIEDSPAPEEVAEAEELDKMLQEN